MTTSRRLLVALVMTAACGLSWGEQPQPVSAHDQTPAAGKPVTFHDTWGVGELYTEWLPMNLPSDETAGTDLYCRSRDCLSLVKTGRAPLYRLKFKSARKGLEGSHHQPPENTLDVVTYTSQLSNYQYDRATEEVVQGEFHVKLPLALIVTKRSADKRMKMVVYAPEGTASDAIPVKTPGGNGTIAGGGPSRGSKPRNGQPSRDRQDAKPPENPATTPSTNPSETPATGTTPAPSLDPEEGAKLLDDFLRSRLSDADKAEFDRLLTAAKTPADRDYVRSAFLKKVAPSIDKQVLKDLDPPTRKVVCGQLEHEFDPSMISPEFKEAPESKSALEQLVRTEAGETTPDGSRIATGSTSNPPPIKAPRSKLVSQTKDTRRMSADCANLALADAKGTPGLKTEIPAPSDSSGVKKKDPNAKLNLQAGITGALTGALVGSMVGGSTTVLGISVAPVFLGAVVGFFLFWGLNKILK